MVFPNFSLKSQSLIKKHLSPDLYTSLASARTGSGFTLEQAIQSGVKNLDSSIGIYAGDEESYTLFSKIFNPIILEYHTPMPGEGHKKGYTQVALPLLDPDNAFILSSRIRVARSLQGFSFPCHMSAGERLEVESNTTQALAALPRNLAGDYSGFSNLNPGEYKDLVRQKLAFPKGDRFQEAAGMNREFPLARGVFLSKDKGFRVWINEEDHLRIISMAEGSDLTKIFNRLIQGLDHLKASLDFCEDNTKGFLTSCPTNIGTAMRAGVHICLKKLEKRPDILTDLISRHHLQVRGTRGEKTAVDQAVFDISNARRLGVSANQIIQDLHGGLTAIIEAEKTL